MLKNIFLKLSALPRSAKRYVLIMLDGIMFPILLWLALFLRLGDGGYIANWLGASYNWLLITLFCVATLYSFNVYKTVVRTFEEKFLQDLMLSVALIVTGLFVVAFFKIIPLPRSTPFTFGFFVFLWVWGTRSAIRMLIRLFLQLQIPVSRIAIYGAGTAGRQTLAALRSAPEYQVVAFFDDDDSLVNTNVQGLRVYAGKDFAGIYKKLEINEVLIALPSATRARRHEVIERLRPLNIKVRSLPGFNHLVDGRVSVSDIDEVDVADLLGRDAVPPSLELMAQNIKDKKVMVTGAGGSIGSELCRQIMMVKPKVLILWEITEFALYSIEKELKSQKSEVAIIPILGSVLHQERMTALLKHYCVDTVYHAAAYKHVPLVEWNPFEGIVNNSIGTYRTAQAAVAAGVSTFVLISTDKAVRPTNVMGASKRLAELSLQALAMQSTTPTRFCMVRFGNVLGSSGSVVPLFRQQIAKGGPVTITHPDITRYFMTIPEASQLVIQAGTMGKGGDVFVLDMGQPVKIIDLARKMIALSGKTVNENGVSGDINIEFSGLRSGEKLYEELLIGDNVTGTEHPRIMRAMESSLSLQVIDNLFEELHNAAQHYDVVKLKELLKQYVEGYVPDMSVLGLMTVSDAVS